jgi:VWFA-related protein
MNPPDNLATRVLAASLLCLFALAPAAFGQERPKGQTPKGPDEEVVRVSTNLVQVDAVVLDKDGRVVAGLRPEDFRLVEDGKPRRITEFSFVSTANAPTAPTETKTDADEGPPSSTPAPTAYGRARRTIALLVDDVGLSFETTAYVRKALTKFVNEQLQPGDLVAVIRTSGGAGSLQQFTSDRRRLLAAVERIRWFPVGRTGASALEAFDPLDNDENGLQQRGTRDSHKIDASGFGYFGGSLGALRYVVEGLGRFPGRKAVVLVSDNLPVTNAGALSGGAGRALQRITDEANRTSVVIYTIDPRGFSKFGLTADDSQYNLAANQIDSRVRERHLRFKASQDGLNYVAEETGGIFLHDTNDLNAGLGRVLEDQRGYYLIGFRPDAESVDASTGRRRFHKLSVEVTRPGLSVRSRSGFYEAGDDARRATQTREEQLREALTAPFNSGDVRLRMTALFADDRKLGPYAHTLIHVTASDLGFKEEADGWRTARFDLITVAFDDEGKVAGQLGRTRTLRTRGEDYERLLREGFVYFVDLPLKKPGGYQLRAAVRDASSGRVGSAGQFVEVPDLNDGRLALSGLIVSGSDSDKTAALAGEGGGDGDGRAADTGPALRRFRRGAAVGYGLYVYGARLDPASQRPRLLTELRLLRDGRPVFKGKALPFDAAGQQDAARLVAGGSFRLGTDLQPGEYVLQLVVTDLLAEESRRTSASWIDFEIVE